MVARATLILCAQALLAKFALSQCYGLGVLGAPFTARGCDIGGPIDYWGYGGRLGYGGFCMPGPAGLGLNPSCGGNLMVTSCSPIAPTGLRVTSENTIEGVLAVIGNLPFLGAVVTDGSFKTSGAGAVSYGCGDGCVGITAENVNVPPLVGPAVPPKLGFAGVPPFGLPYGRGIGFGYRGRCGCGI